MTFPLLRLHSFFHIVEPIYTCMCILCSSSVRVRILVWIVFILSTPYTVPQHLLTLCSLMRRLNSCRTCSLAISEWSLCCRLHLATSGSASHVHACPPCPSIILVHIPCSTTIAVRKSTSAMACQAMWQGATRAPSTGGRSMLQALPPASSCRVSGNAALIKASISRVVLPVMSLGPVYIEASLLSLDGKELKPVKPLQWKIFWMGQLRTQHARA
jgi:hypothetical protein